MTDRLTLALDKLRNTCELERMKGELITKLSSIEQEMKERSAGNSVALEVGNKIFRFTNFRLVLQRSKLGSPVTLSEMTLVELRTLLDIIPSLIDMLTAKRQLELQEVETDDTTTS